MSKRDPDSKRRPKLSGSELSRSLARSGHSELGPILDFGNFCSGLIMRTGMETGSQLAVGKRAESAGLRAEFNFRHA